MDVWAGLGIIVVTYLIGSIPCGLMLGKLKGVDVRQHGSGNIGATNIRRVLGRPWAVGCFICDFAKGFAPVLTVVLTASLWHGWLVPLVAVAAVVGHVWPVYLRFRGGKGVATTTGAVLPVAPMAVGLCAIVWIALYCLTRYVSVASLAAAVVLPLSGAIFYVLEVGTVAVPDVTLLVLLAALVFVRHRTNLVRLIRGQENRFI